MSSCAKSRRSIRRKDVFDNPYEDPDKHGDVLKWVDDSEIKDEPGGITCSPYLSWSIVVNFSAHDNRHIIKKATIAATTIRMSDVFLQCLMGGGGNSPTNNAILRLKLYTPDQSELPNLEMAHLMDLGQPRESSRIFDESDLDTDIYRVRQNCVDFGNCNVKHPLFVRFTCLFSIFPAYSHLWPCILCLFSVCCAQFNQIRTSLLLCPAAKGSACWCLGLC